MFHTCGQRFTTQTVEAQLVEIDSALGVMLRALCPMCGCGTQTKRSDHELALRFKACLPGGTATTKMDGQQRPISISTPPPKKNKKTTGNGGTIKIKFAKANASREDGGGQTETGAWPSPDGIHRDVGSAADERESSPASPQSAASWADSVDPRNGWHVDPAGRSGGLLSSSPSLSSLRTQPAASGSTREDYLHEPTRRRAEEEASQLCTHNITNGDRRDVWAPNGGIPRSNAAPKKTGDARSTPAGQRSGSKKGKGKGNQKERATSGGNDSGKASILT